MEPRELEKSKVHITVELVEYVHNSVVIKTILKKTSGNISLMSFDGEGLTEKHLHLIHLRRSLMVMPKL